MRNNLKLAVLCFSFLIAGVVALQSVPAHAASNNQLQAYADKHLEQSFMFRHRLVTDLFHKSTLGKVFVSVEATACRQDRTMKVGVFQDGDNSRPMMSMNECGGGYLSGDLPPGDYYVTLLKDDDEFYVGGTVSVSF